MWTLVGVAWCSQFQKGLFRRYLYLFELSVNKIFEGQLRMELLFGISQLFEGSLFCLCSEDESFVAVTIARTLLATNILSFSLRVYGMSACVKV